MYDKSRNISGEHPEHIHFIYNVAKPLFESWGYEVVILRADVDYLDIFNHVITRPTKHLDHKGKKYGFVPPGLCSIKRDCKERPIQRYLSSFTKPYIQYVGICADEPRRLESMHKCPTKVSLLEKYGYTQAMNRVLCESLGLLSPCYKYSKRGGCWMCPWAKPEEQKAFKELHLEVWREFVELEDKECLANPRWNIFKESLRDIDRRIDGIAF